VKKIHLELLKLAQTNDLGKLTYRKIGQMLGGEHPYQVQYNIRQLLKTGRLLQNKRTGSIYVGGLRPIEQQVINIPIFGSVSCGVPVEFANNEHQGFLTVSPSLINNRGTSKLFALKAVGDSMNMAKIGGVAVEDDDFVIVCQSEWGEAKNGDYVVSLIGDCANLKRLRIDEDNHRVILLSETTEDYPPILVAEEDILDYRILGIATDVIKAV
jgi:SOS-response transcriptional repressor LexA